LIVPLGLRVRLGTVPGLAALGLAGFGRLVLALAFAFSLLALPGLIVLCRLAALLRIALIGVPA
jgi:hypothetical protein